MSSVGYWSTLVSGSPATCSTSPSTSAGYQLARTSGPNRGCAPWSGAISSGTLRDLVPTTRRWICTQGACSSPVRASGKIILTSLGPPASGPPFACSRATWGMAVFGMSAAQPYVSRKTLGCYIQGDRLNQSGALEFEMLADYCDEGVWPLLEPDSKDIFGVDYSFSLVFWEVIQPVPEKPISSYYDFYKLLLRSSDRMEGGTAADRHIPLTFSTSRSMLSSTTF
jgi:hypothetical protein